MRRMRLRRAWRLAQSWVSRGLWVLLVTLALGGATVHPRDETERIRRFTRQVEFDFVTWTLDALGVKLGQLGLGASGYLRESDRRALVLEYARLVDQGAQTEQRLLEVSANPGESSAEQAAAIETELGRLRARMRALQPVVEAVLQEQVAVILNKLGLTAGGAPFPPVAFHFSRTPLALIVSPRTVIRQDADIQLEADLSMDEQSALERRVESTLDVSALVVPVGGVGTYPTMVQESGSVTWLGEVVGHEWTHNYLSLHPLGLNYDVSPELRTMNETAASLMGQAISRLVLETYYPELMPPAATEAPPPEPGTPSRFDFRAEMHTTRVEVDALLAEGRVAEAEAYMEARRQVFWDQGYRIRRLNQAYFAFYGAYAEEPGGAAGEDPVGEAVRALWGKSLSPASFLRKIAWMNEFADLEAALEAPATTR